MYSLSTKHLSRSQITKEWCRKIVEDSGYREDYLATQPTFYLFKMTYEPYSWLATYKKNRDYLIQKGEYKAEDFIEYTYEVQNVEVQLSLF